MEVVNTTTTTDPVNMYNNLNNFILNPIIFIIIILIVVAYYAFSSSSLGSNLGTSEDSNNGNIFGVIIIVILVILILVNALQYFLSINVTAYINGLFTPNTKVDIVVDQSRYQPTSVPEIKFKKQVFNIPGNYYNYEKSKRNDLG